MCNPIKTRDQFESLSAIFSGDKKRRVVARIKIMSYYDCIPKSNLGVGEMISVVNKFWIFPGFSRFLKSLPLQSISIPLFRVI